MFRIQPNLQPGMYQTYAYSRSLDTRRKAACRDVGCEAYRAGWESRFDESTALGREQAHYVRTQSGRTFREYRSAEGLTVFRFEPYQRCFADHQTIAEAFFVRGGDWRQDQGLIRHHANGRDWAEDMGEHQQHLADRIEKG
jgi:hypothetical protein